MIVDHVRALRKISGAIIGRIASWCWSYAEFIHGIHTLIEIERVYELITVSLVRVPGCQVENGNYPPPRAFPVEPTHHVGSKPGCIYPRPMVPRTSIRETLRSVAKRPLFHLLRCQTRQASAQPGRHRRGLDCHFPSSLFYRPGALA